MSFDKLDISVDEHIAKIILRNPPVNALSAQLVTQLAEAGAHIADLVKKNEVRVVIISGDGKHFSAGADLKERMAMPEEEVANAVKAIGRAVDAVWNIEVPVIAAISGAALGGGLELALAADIRVIAEDAKLSLKEVSLGILPGAGGTQRLSRIVGVAKATEWITTAQDISVGEALISGLANHIVTGENVFDAAVKVSREISKNAPIAVRASKKAIRDGFDLPLKEALKLEADQYSKTISTQDRLEGLEAFAQKREPKYTGK